LQAQQERNSRSGRRAQQSGCTSSSLCRAQKSLPTFSGLGSLFWDMQARHPQLPMRNLRRDGRTNTCPIRHAQTRGHDEVSFTSIAGYGSCYRTAWPNYRRSPFTLACAFNRSAIVRALVVDFSCVLDHNTNNEDGLVLIDEQGRERHWSMTGFDLTRGSRAPTTVLNPHQCGKKAIGCGTALWFNLWPWCQPFLSEWARIALAMPATTVIAGRGTVEVAGHLTHVSHVVRHPAATWFGGRLATRLGRTARMTGVGALAHRCP